MENQVNSKSIILNYGLMLAVVSIIVSLISYATGTHFKPHWSTSVITIIAFIALVVLGIKKFKGLNNGFLSFGQAVKTGVGIAIISALIGSVYQYIFMNFIEPDFMSQMLEIQQQSMIDQGMSEEQIEAAQEMGAKFSSPLMMSAFGIIGSAIGGFIISAIAGAIMKKTEENDY